MRYRQWKIFFSGIILISMSYSCSKNKVDCPAGKVVNFDEIFYSSNDTLRFKNAKENRSISFIVNRLTFSSSYSLTCGDGNFEDNSCECGEAAYSLWKSDFDDSAEVSIVYNLVTREDSVRIEYDISKHRPFTIYSELIKNESMFKDSMQIGDTILFKIAEISMLDHIRSGESSKFETLYFQSKKGLIGIKLYKESGVYFLEEY